MRTEKCSRHPEVDALHVDTSANNAPLCVTCVLADRRDKPGARRAIRKLSEIDAPITPGRNAAKVCFQVLGGILPGRPLDEVTEEWWISGDEWDRMTSDAELTPDSPNNLFVRYGDEARWYQERVTDPRAFNWVRLEFIFF